jgi:hypothetical protein
MLLAELETVIIQGAYIVARRRYTQALQEGIGALIQNSNIPGAEKLGELAQAILEAVYYVDEEITA